MRRPTKSALRLLIAFSIIANVSCGTLPKPPRVEICQIDIPQKTCYIFVRQANCANCEFKYQGQRKLSSLDKFFAVSPSQYQSLRDYVNELTEALQTRCQ